MCEFALPLEVIYPNVFPFRFSLLPFLQPTSFKVWLSFGVLRISIQLNYERTQTLRLFSEAQSLPIKANSKQWYLPDLRLGISP